jgi:hypothetical protein
MPFSSVYLAVAHAVKTRKDLVALKERFASSSAPGGAIS